MGLWGNKGDGEDNAMIAAYPDCLKCRHGRLLPLSDYGREGAPITFKAWVCSNPECGYNLRIDNGEISMGRVLGHSTK
jgi:hypothetical protein